MLDGSGRPYFLWDTELTLDAFEHRLHDPDEDVRAYFVGKLMRQAKPDDVFTFVTMAQIAELWPQLDPYLGKSREFWRWLLDWWNARQHGGGRARAGQPGDEQP